MNPRLPVAAVAALLLLAGCVSYEPRPIDPARRETGFRARSLDDPAIRDAFGRRGLPVPARGRALGLDEISLIALAVHPDIAVARAKAVAVAASEITAGQSPNPSLKFVPQVQANNVPPTTPWTLGFTLDIPIETAGKRDKRVDRAGAAAAAAGWEMAETFWAVRARARDAAVSHLLATRRAESLRAEADARSEVVALLEARLKAGEAARPEVDVLEVSRVDAVLAAGVAESEARVAGSRLAGALGLPESALDGVTLDASIAERGVATALDPATEIGRLQQVGLLNRLDVRRSLAEYAFAEADLRLEIAKQYPDVHLGPGYQWDTGDHEFYVGIGVELPVFNQNQGPIAEAKARRDHAAARFDAVQAVAIGQIEQATARYAGVRAELDEADRLLALRDRQMRAAEASLQAGQGDRLALAESRSLLLTARRARLGIVSRLQTAVGQLEDALQRPLDGSFDIPNTTASQDATAR